MVVSWGWLCIDRKWLFTWEPKLSDAAAPRVSWMLSGFFQWSLDECDIKMVWSCCTSSFICRIVCFKNVFSTALS
jgi:hypothetical protein